MADSSPSVQSPAPEPELFDSRYSALLHHALAHPVPPAHRQVFVNRTLRMETIKFVGFDLDWTLADYERLPLEELTFGLAVERLIGHLGYPEEVKNLEFRPEFPRRGLIVDREAGTVLRMNRHRYVGQAYLGRRRLNSREVIRLYRQEPIQPASERFYHVDSLFELPETNVFSELVELSERRPSLGLPDFPRLFADVRSCVDWIHARGGLKPSVVENIPKYLKKDRELGIALQRLLLGGRQLILITNSPWDYVQALCSYLFDGLLPGLDDWRQLFALVVVESGKPDFFRQGRPFVELDADGQPQREVETPDWGGVYSGGSLEALMRLLGCRGEQVLYVGDHIYGDVVSSKRESTWRTALIVRELEEELTHSETLVDDVARLTALRYRLAGLGHQMDRVHDVLEVYRRMEADGAELSSGALEETQALFAQMKGQHRNLLRRVGRLSERISERYNRDWGAFFHQGSSKSLFARQVDAYACLYTSRASNFGFYGTHHYYRVIEDPMLHEFTGR